MIYRGLITRITTWLRRTSVFLRICACFGTRDLRTSAILTCNCNLRISFVDLE